VRFVSWEQLANSLDRLLGDCLEVTRRSVAAGTESLTVAVVLRARGHAGNRRLYSRWQGFTDRKKSPLVANVAVARELSGWRWSLATCKATAARSG